MNSTNYSKAKRNILLESPSQNASNALNILTKDRVLNKFEIGILQIHSCSMSNETIAFRSAIAPAIERKKKEHFNQVISRGQTYIKVNLSLFSHTVKR